MNQPFRLSSAASLIVVGSMIAGCAAHQARFGSTSHFGGKADVDTGLATRAMVALNSNKVPLAIELAERAVAKTPHDAGFRALLGNAYFAAGRFHSAESAYRDSLVLYTDQPQVVLKLALVEIAQGRANEAVAFLNGSRDVLNASDFGLALALAGHPGEAIGILDHAARQKDADATVRQNLALAQALAGNWSEARTIAAQDVPGNQLDSRMQQWMLLASPKHPADQVAALVGVTPATVDAGQPVQLALIKDDSRVAEAVVPAPVAVPTRAPVASLSPAAPKAVVAAAPAVPAKVTFVPAVAPVSLPPFIRATPAAPAPTSTISAIAATAVTQAKAVLASVMPPSREPAKPARARSVATVRPAMHEGNSAAVVQLGAYKSSERVLAAWSGVERKYPALKAYLPMSARFASPKGTFYRLSVRGFGNAGEASALCNTLHREGGACFVRRSAGDAPVNYALR